MNRSGNRVLAAARVQAPGTMIRAYGNAMTGMQRTGVWSRTSKPSLKSGLATGAAAMESVTVKEKENHQPDPRANERTMRTARDDKSEEDSALHDEEECVSVKRPMWGMVCFGRRQ